MHKEKVNLDEIKLVGVSIRTNNSDEMNPEKSKIGAIAGRYWKEQLANKFKNRKNPGITYSVYTDFASDENGEYTYFIGEEVDSLEDQDLSEFKTLVISASAYQKFTTPCGKMPDIIIGAWQEIWQMAPSDFSGKRTYKADFEMYDHRAVDPNNSEVDIYIGVDV